MRPTLFTIFGRMAASNNKQENKKAAKSGFTPDTYPHYRNETRSYIPPNKYLK